MSHIVTLILILFLSGNSRDLLELMPTDAYWKAKSVTVSPESMLLELGSAPQADTPATAISTLIKDLGADEFQTRKTAKEKIRAIGPTALPQLEQASKSTDPETANAARDLIKSIAGAPGSKAAEIRKLMAIRTLGELKAKDALPTLDRLSTSTEPFVAEYAHAAKAAINNQPYTRPTVTAQQRAADVAMLPSGCGVVAQMTFANSKPTSLDTLVELSMPRRFGAENEDEEAIKLRKAEMLATTQRQLLEILERIGNLRADSATLGVASDVGRNNGFVAIFRGQYDPAALPALFNMRRAGMADDPNTGTTQVNDIAVFRQRDITLIMPSSTCLILAAAPNKDSIPVEAMTKAYKTNTGDLGPDMTKLVATIDTNKPLWAVMKVSETYRLIPLFNPFDTLTLTMDRKDGQLLTVINAAGTEAASIATTVDMVNNALDKSREQLKDQTDLIPNSKELLEFLANIKVQAQGNTASLTATIKDDPKSFGSLPGTFLGVRTLPMNKRRLPAIQVPANAPPK